MEKDADIWARMDIHLRDNRSSLGALHATTSSYHPPRIIILMHYSQVISRSWARVSTGKLVFKQEGSASLLRTGGRCIWGAGIALWFERRARDRKVAGSIPGRSGGRTFFPNVNFLCSYIGICSTPLLPQ